MNLCKTCSSPFESNQVFCSNCGAKHIKERLTIRRLSEQLYSNIISLDIPFFNTFKTLLFSPEKVTIGYIQGVRKIISSPIQFAIIILSIYGLFQFFFSEFIEMTLQQDVWSGMEEGFSSYETGKEDDVVLVEKFKQFMGFFQQHNQFVNFLSIPFLSMLSMLFYKSKKFNFAEHIVIALYAVSLPMLIGIIIGIIMAPFKSESIVEYYLQSTMILQVIIMVWVYKKTMDDSILKPIFISIISYILLLLSITIFFFTYMIFYLSI